MSRFFPGHHAAWYVGLLLFWFALGGAWDLQHLIMGVAIIYVALGLRSRVVPRSPSRAGVATTRPPGASWRGPLQAVSYLIYLLVEVVKANVQVAFIVLNPKLPVSPVFLSYHPQLRSVWGRVLLANSITLTPGTLTIELEGDDYLIHTLTRAAAEALPGWPAEHRVHELETLFEGVPENV
jgi:multicomponent Na+:H+ antiporter subunit E